MINNIFINTIAPVLFAYGIYCKEQAWKERAIEWLSLLPAEKKYHYQAMAANTNTLQISFRFPGADRIEE